MTATRTKKPANWRRRARVPLLIGLVVGALVWYVAWRAVSADITRFRSVGMASSRETGFVWTMAIMCAAATFFAARRLLGGRRAVVREWTLFVPEAAPREAGYRECGQPHLEDLVKALERRGYHVRVENVDRDGDPAGASDLRAPLASVRCWLGDNRLAGAPAGVLVLLEEPKLHARGLGTVQAHDTGGRKHEEMASYVMAELDGLIPGITYKSSDSTLSPDSATLLRETLPDAPLALHGK